MKLWLDEYAHLDSPLHRWDARYKLVGLLGLIFAFASVDDLRLVPGMLAVTGVLYAASRLPFSFLLSRLRYPGVFLLVVAILLPLLTGHTMLVSIGPLTLRQEGFLLMLIILTRFATILTVSLVLFGTSPFLITVRAMQALGLPTLLTDMVLFFYRYLNDTADQLATMQTAMRLRGFHSRQLSRQSASALAALAGSLLVRSYEQSERVYHAMVLRGYGHTPLPPDSFRANAADRLVLYVVLLVAGGIVTANVMLKMGMG